MRSPAKTLTGVLASALLLALAATPARAVEGQAPTPDPISGNWRLMYTGTTEAPGVWGSVAVTSSGDSFIGTARENTFFMGDSTCEFQAGEEIWRGRRVGLEDSTRVRYEGRALQISSDSSIGCQRSEFDAWWEVSLTDGKMTFSTPLWNRVHGLQRIDTTPPAVNAVDATARRGKPVALSWGASEESGWAHFAVTIKRGTKVLARRGYDHVFAASAGETQTIMWNVPKRITGPLAFCVTGTDGSGNTSRRSCADIKLRVVDNEAPRVRAYKASGLRGQEVRLTFWIADDSGELDVTVTVRIGGRTVAKRSFRDVSARPKGERHFIDLDPQPSWTSNLDWCVRVEDGRGRVRRDCAPIELDEEATAGSERSPKVATWTGRWTARATTRPPTRKAGRVAHDTAYRSRVEILVLTPEPNDTYLFDGRVRSKKQSCVDGRKVLLYRRKAGPDELIATVRASDEGFWFVRKKGADPGTYYAHVARKLIGPRGHRHICTAADSGFMRSAS